MADDRVSKKEDNNRRRRHSRSPDTRPDDHHHRSRKPYNRHDRDDREYRHRDSRKNDRNDQREFVKKEQDNDRASREQFNQRREKNHRKRKGGNPFQNKEDDNYEYGKPEEEEKEEEPAIDKEKPNFETTGNLAADTNTFNGVVIKYNEPPEARKPRTRWRLYAFKADTELPMLQIHRQSAYLLGRDRLVADIPIHHPSCSKQHAILQYRIVGYDRNDGTRGKRIRPFILDLESSNGTFVNNQKIDSKRYVELLEKDVIKFGYSSREYVLLHEESKGEDSDVEDDESLPKTTE